MEAVRIDICFVRSNIEVISRSCGRRKDERSACIGISVEKLSSMPLGMRRMGLVSAFSRGLESAASGDA